jgi:hypothetical protein
MEVNQVKRIKELEAELGQYNSAQAQEIDRYIKSCWRMPWLIPCCALIFLGELMGCRFSSDLVNVRDDLPEELNTFISQIFCVFIVERNAE